jgi:photosystem II stability/assembly factor-like uncharacterized protein
MPAQTIWIGTRKGAFVLRSDERRKTWKLAGPQFLGHVIHHIVQDPRNPKSILIAAKTGHLGPTVFRSSDRGKTWKEATRPPAFRKAADGENGRAVERVFWLTPGLASQKGVWYAGTSPVGLFRSEDAGEQWEPVAGFNEHPMLSQWSVGAGTPDGPLMHSILIDPRDATHMYVGLSSGGVFESTDAGRDWTPLNEGCAADFLRRVASAAAGSAVSAESLRHLSARSAGAALDSHRQGDAEEGRRHRLSYRPASCEAGHSVGDPDGRHDGVAENQCRRQACGVHDEQCGEDVAATGQGSAAGAVMDDGVASGDVRRSAVARGAVFRHDRRRSLGGRE